MEQTLQTITNPDEVFVLTKDKALSFYGELVQYVPPGKLDLLTQGVQAFLQEVDKLREWGDRVLSMKRQVSVWKASVRPIAVAKRRYFERQVANELATSDFKKGLDAKERRAVAESYFANEEDDALRWQELEKLLTDLYNDLADKYRQLYDAKADIRANLMSLRLQLVLERAGSSLSDLLSEKGLRTAAQQVTEVQKGTPPDSLGGEEEPALQLDPAELDGLLNGKG